MAQAGWLAAINYAGYLSGAVIASRISDLVLKDRLYTARADGLPRRSAQTALWHLATAMVRWLAPILNYLPTAFAEAAE